MNSVVYERLKRDAQYALNSKSLTLVHETCGAAKMAFNLGAITKSEMSDLNTMLVREGINNPEAGLE